VQLVPLQNVPRLCVVSQALPQAPQLVIDESELSQPSVSGGDLLQSAYPEAHPVYAHVPAAQAAPKLWVTSHALPHTLHALPVTCVSQPFVSGAVVLQSAYPDPHPAYTQVVPSHETPVLNILSHALPQPAQLVMVRSDVSHPFTLGGVVSQSP
jgi:hypothetical protein